MLNAYERSAVAESQEGIGVLVADNAPEQPIAASQKLTSAQMLVGVVQHNLDNPENRLQLTSEQAQAVMTDLMASASGDDAPQTADGRTLTFNEMDDEQLTKCLSDYLGSGVSNNSINGALIEGAQDLMAEQYMSDEELEDLPNPKTAKGREMRERKLFDRMRDAAQDEAESRAKWEKDVWANQTYDVGNLKLTGKQIDVMIETLEDPQKKAKLAEEYKSKYGGTTEDADDILTDTEKYLKAKKRYEYLKASNQLDKMTLEEKTNLELIKTNPKIQKAVELIEEKSRANTKDYGVNTSNTEFSKSNIDQRMSAITEQNSGERKALRIGSSAASEYQDDGKPAIKAAFSPQAEFNPLGNPATAEVATANMNNQKPAPPIIVADNKITSTSVDMM